MITALIIVAALCIAGYLGLVLFMLYAGLTLAKCMDRNNP